MREFFPKTECRLRLESVKLEKDIHGVKSKCSSVQKVLRCLPGCYPTKTTMTTVGFHCKPISECLEITAATFT